ncbi:MBL fold metallo-hydrolase [Spirosoma agri]|uniref:MBL fold metallo-hydrolase n=1 Tax=Spirosoma agri TaxID=1987381 RepID=A0A6M0IPQ9_9BACT|nr:MBL fold metallo-hydrolase [Spirosoma agri]NEU70258.1 MBL fold metallo-hydrolase [Spirosoma agri]
MQRKTFLKQTASLSALSLVQGTVPTRLDRQQADRTKEAKVCTTCGTHYPTGKVVELCPICLDDRQYIPDTGQGWTTSQKMEISHSIKIVKLQEHLYELVINPKFAIGQRALLVLSPGGNILWDCIPLLDEPTMAFIQGKGGLKAIAISHPHYYSNMCDWAEQFNCPVYIHQSDEVFIHDRGEYVQLWTGQQQPLWDGTRLINIGGHFPGSSLLHVPALSPEGTLLVGDTLYLSPSMAHFALMYSYPNRIPLPLHEIVRIRNRFAQLSFDTVYGFYSYQNLTVDVKKILNESFQRYYE